MNLGLCEHFITQHCLSVDWVEFCNVVCFIYFLRYKETYTWQNVNCCIHNIIVGQLWVEHVRISLFVKFTREGERERSGDRERESKRGRGRERERVREGE